MNTEIRLMFGKVLGEIYRVQKRIDEGMCPVSDATIYGLLNGFETVVEAEMTRVGHISNEKFDNMCKVLGKYFNDEEKLKAFRGYYDIEHELGELGIDRTDAIRILRYLKANHSYEELIQKMDSPYSPVECKKFDISEYDN